MDSCISGTEQYHTSKLHKTAEKKYSISPDSKKIITRTRNIHGFSRIGNISSLVADSMLLERATE